MKYYLFSTTFLLLLLSSCADIAVPIITYDIQKSDYLDVVRSVGTVQAVTTYPVMSPRVSGLTITWLAKDGALVNEGDTVCILRSETLERNLDAQRISLEQLQTDLINLEMTNASNMAKLEMDVETNKTSMSITELDSLQRKFLPAVQQKLLDLKFQQAEIAQSKLLKRVASTRSLASSDVRRLKSSISSTEAQIKTTESQLSKLSLVAPKSGIIMRVSRSGIGISIFSDASGRYTSSYLGEGLISEGTSAGSNECLLQIPDLSKMQILIMIPEIDYKRIEVGQKAGIRVESVSDLVTTGSVEKKSLAGNTTEYESRYSRGASATVKKYEVILSVDSCHIMMKPGLSASCDIIINEVKDTIVIPSVAVFVRDSTKVVYVVEGKFFRPVPVETGLSNSARTIISRGVKVGQTIALMEPPHQSLIKVKLEPNIKQGSSDSVKGGNDSVIQMSSTK